MKNFARTLTALAVATGFAASPALAATGASTPATATAQVVKPLVLSAKQNLDFGTVVVASTSTTGTATMTLAGVVSCTTGLTCSGAPKPAIFNVQGSNNQVVKIYSAATNLTGPGGATLVFTPAIPTSVTLTSSGAPGNDFNVGGSIAIAANQADGVYVGAMNVTVDYN